MSDPALVEILGRDGPWTSVYTDGTGALPQVEEEAHRRSVKDRLIDAGAPEADAATAESALSEHNGLPSPSARVLLISGGQVALDRGFVGARLGAERFDHGPLPQIAPLLRHLGATVRYLVVETSRDGAAIRLETSGRGSSDAELEIEGETEDITKVQAGGWSHAGFQRYAENTWKHNQDDVASAVSGLIREQHPTFIAVSGDVRARQLLSEALSETERDLIVDVDVHTRTAGSDSGALDGAVAQAINGHTEERIREVRDRAAADNGSGGAEGIGEVVTALQQARVDTLLLDGRMLDEDRTLLALDGPPWVATDESQRLTAEIIAVVSAPEALARAAVLTDAQVLVEEDEPSDEAAPREDRDVRRPLAALRWRDER